VVSSNVIHQKEIRLSAGYDFDASGNENGQPSKPCAVVSIYEDLGGRDLLLRLCDSLVQKFSDDLEFHIDWWRFKYLADPDSHIAGILGCGVQNRAALRALVEVLPRLSEVRCRDILPAATRRYVEEMSRLFPQLRFKAEDSEERMIDGADVVVTATPIVKSPRPSLDADMLKLGGLAVSLDYDSAWTSAATPPPNAP